jgi:protein-tyrosine kinase
MRLRSTAARPGPAEIPQPIAASSLGTTLVAIGALQPEELDHLRTGCETLDDADLVALAIERGLVSEDDVNRARDRQQRASLLSDEDQSLDPLIVTAFSSAAPLARQARSLRASLSVARRPDGSVPRTLVVLSAGAEAETAVLAANLAVASAQAGYRTLLVDANLESPVQHRLFRTPNRSGVINLLSDDEDALDYVQTTTVHGLWLMTAGPTRTDASRLLDRQGLCARLRPISDSFDLILVDGSHADDATRIPPGADSALLAVRTDHSSLLQVKQMVAQLEAAGVPLSGTIMLN